MSIKPHFLTLNPRANQQTKLSRAQGLTPRSHFSPFESTAAMYSPLNDLWTCIKQLSKNFVFKFIKACAAMHNTQWSDRLNQTGHVKHETAQDAVCNKAKLWPITQMRSVASGQMCRSSEFQQIKIRRNKQKRGRVWRKICKRMNALKTPNLKKKDRQNDTPRRRFFRCFSLCTLIRPDLSKFLIGK